MKFDIVFKIGYLRLILFFKYFTILYSDNIKLIYEIYA